MTGKDEPEKGNIKSRGALGISRGQLLGHRASMT